MFKNLFDLSVKRDAKNAIGFYIVYLLLFMLLGGFLNAFVARFAFPQAVTFQDGINYGSQVALYTIPIFAFITTTLLSFFIIKLKGIINAKSIIMAVLSILITPVFGGVFGFIFLAILTTIGNNKTND